MLAHSAGMVTEDEGVEVVVDVDVPEVAAVVIVRAELRELLELLGDTVGNDPVRELLLEVAKVDLLVCVPVDWISVLRMMVAFVPELLELLELLGDSVGNDVTTELPFEDAEVVMPVLVPVDWISVLRVVTVAIPELLELLELLGDTVGNDVVKELLLENGAEVDVPVLVPVDWILVLGVAVVVVPKLLELLRLLELLKDSVGNDVATELLAKDAEVDVPVLVPVDWASLLEVAVVCCFLVLVVAFVVVAVEVLDVVAVVDVVPAPFEVAVVPTLVAKLEEDDEDDEAEAIQPRS